MLYADGKVVTPTSDSILPSCTKGVLLQVARDLGYTVEERPYTQWRSNPRPHRLHALICG